MCLGIVKQPGGTQERGCTSQPYLLVIGFPYLLLIGFNFFVVSLYFYLDVPPLGDVTIIVKRLLI